MAKLKNPLFGPIEAEHSQTTEGKKRFLKQLKRAELESKYWQIIQTMEEKDRLIKDLRVMIAQNDIEINKLKKQLSEKPKEEYCHECSKSGGAERAIYHTPPICSSKRTKDKVLIVQMHWQFKDGGTKIVSEISLESPFDIIQKKVMDDFVKKTQDTHPLPKDAVWLICNQYSQHWSSNLELTDNLVADQS